MAAPSLPPRSVKKKALNLKNYVLWALMATITAAVVVTAVFVVLSPARIYFSVTDACSHQSSGGAGGMQLSLTLAANNSSPHTRVEYDSLFVDVTNSTSGPPLYFTRANTTATPMPLRQPAHNVTAIAASVSLVQGVWAGAIPGNATSRPFAVIITTSVRFRIGFARTRLYDIKVTCTPVIFVPNNPRAAKQISAAPAALLPVPCA